jgi:hypothetical protein
MINHFLPVMDTFDAIVSSTPPSSAGAREGKLNKLFPSTKAELHRNREKEIKKD